MQDLLLETKQHLQSFDYARTSSASTSRLASAIEVHADQDKTKLAKLPEELLLLLATLLQVPKVCARDEEDLEASDILKRERFNNHAPSLLQLSLAMARLLPSPAQPSLEDLSARARMLITFGRFTQLVESEGFTSESSVLVSNDICAILLAEPSRRALIQQVLSKTFPPYFKAHPKLNPSTGRVLSRPTGGDHAMTDWYEEDDEEDQRTWRSQPWLGNVVRVVVSALEKNETEDLWPLLLPPLLAYLDDWHPPNKLIGTSILEALLPGVDGSLLIRTGVGKVSEQSLTAAFSALSSPISPSLLLATHRVSLTLLDLLHSASSTSPDRFNALASLLIDGIIHIWEFRSGHIALELAAATALPPLLHELGVGTVRFLNVIIPHLCDVLAGTKLGSAGTAELLLAVCAALEAALVQGQSRAARWKGVVLSGVGRCWTALKEAEEGREWRKEHPAEVTEVEWALRAVLARMASDDDLDKLRSLDPLFAELVSPPPEPISCA